MTDLDHEREPIERAEAAARAARLILADRRCEPEDARAHLLDAWKWLRVALGDPEPHSAEERLLADRDWDRRQLRGELALLDAELRHEKRDMQPRFLRVLRPAAAVLVIVAAVVAVVLFVRAWPEPEEHGWRAAYYPALAFQGEPAEKQELEIRFEWLDEPPVEGFPRDRFSVRWDTCLHLEEPQEIEFRLGTDDGGRLYVDGEKVVDTWGDHSFRWDQGARRLDRGPHHVVVEYYEKTGPAQVDVRLLLPGRTQEPVPLAWLRIPERPVGAEGVCR